MPAPTQPPRPDRELLALASDASGAWEEAGARLLARGASVLPLLERGLDDPRLGAAAHWRILRLLARLGRPESLPAIRAALHRALDHGNAPVLGGALEALAALAIPEAVGELVALLGHTDADIVRRVAALVGQTRSPAALAPLVHLLEHADPSLRYAAVHGLTGLDSPAARAALSVHLPRETDAEVRALIRSAGVGPGRDQ